MVSTRGFKVKFSEGERVLCYEPDPTKAKVLYDSKVLQVFVDKDASGKKQIDYLIHFQGWNSSWDRKVPEHFVLKCTAENRELQKQLADEANIKLSIKSNRILAGPGYSSKEKRKRRLSETIREALEQERRNQAESETSSPASMSIEDEGSSASWGEASIASNEEVEVPEIPKDDEITPNDDTFNKFFPLTLPLTLKKVLEEDFRRIHDDQMISLPVEKNIVNILEDYVRFFAVRYVTKPRARSKNETKHRDNMYITLDLCKEVVDGIRISFESYVETLLLYPTERQQIQDIRSSLLKNEDMFKSQPTARNEQDDAKLTPKPIEKKEEVSTRRVLRSKRRPSDELAPASVEQSVPHSASESGRSTPTTNVSGGSTSGLYSLSEGDHTNMPLHLRGISHLLQNWSLVPEKYRDPSSLTNVLGAIHLLRLFVNLPEIFYRMALTPDRKKILLTHLDLFLDYMATHEEFFKVSQYIPRKAS